MSESATEKPFWRLDVRHRLGLEPGKNDPISRLLFGALYESENEDQFKASVLNHIEELSKAAMLISK